MKSRSLGCSHSLSRRDGWRFPHGTVLRQSGRRLASAVLTWIALASPMELISAPAGPVPGLHDVSYRNEVQMAIDRGLTWLAVNQNSNGWWSTPDQPAMTGLALMAFRGDPSGRHQDLKSPVQAKGYSFLMGCVQPDGGIHRTNLVIYNTSIGMMALLAADKVEYEPTILKARQFLVGLQADFGEKGRVDNPFDGGIGYGSKYDHSDMGNTSQAVEALYYSKRLLRDKNVAGAKDLNWDALVHFLQSCQNLPSHNKETWANDAPENKGGFIYYPSFSMAGGETNGVTGRVALRSYGSISYAGMMSYLYADLKRDDPRVTAVFDWLRMNYTLQENPGMGSQGLYYYFHTMAKALTVHGVEDLQLPDGKRVFWRRELSERLLNLQQKDGSWVNGTARWLEKDPALVTAYCVLTLDMIFRGL